MTNYFLINKKLDYDRGFLQDLEFKDGRLRLAEGASYGVFFSRVFDSRESGTVWHRFSAEKDGSGVPLQVSFYSFEEPEITVRGEKQQLHDVPLPGGGLEQRELGHLLPVPRVSLVMTVRSAATANSSSAC